MLSSQGVNFQLDVITDYGSDPLQVWLHSQTQSNLVKHGQT